MQAWTGAHDFEIPKYMYEYKYGRRYLLQWSARLHATMNKLNLRVAILGSVQSIGYDSPTENQNQNISLDQRTHAMVADEIR